VVAEDWSGQLTGDAAALNQLWAASARWSFATPDRTADALDLRPSLTRRMNLRAHVAVPPLVHATTVVVRDEERRPESSSDLCPSLIR
jgi:hypothetical protein